jgi:hypothetical protein
MKHLHTKSFPAWRDEFNAFQRFWQVGQKKVDRWPCTSRRIGAPHTRHGSFSRP